MSPERLNRSDVKGRKLDMGYYDSQAQKLEQQRGAEAREKGNINPQEQLISDWRWISPDFNPQFIVPPTAKNAPDHETRSLQDKLFQTGASTLAIGGTAVIVAGWLSMGLPAVVAWGLIVFGVAAVGYSLYRLYEAWFD